MAIGCGWWGRQVNWQGVPLGRGWGAGCSISIVCGSSDNDAASTISMEVVADYDANEVMLDGKIWVTAEVVFIAVISTTGEGLYSGCMEI